MQRDAQTLDALFDESFAREIAKAFAPPPLDKPSDWIARNVSMPNLSFIPGPFQLNPLQAPVIDDSIFGDGVREVILMWSAQLGKTSCLLAGLVYATQGQQIEGAQMLVRADDQDALNWSREILQPTMIASGFRMGTGTQNGLRHVRSETSALSIVGSWNPAALSSRTLLFCWGDETDRWCLTTPQGRPLDLIRQRLKLLRQSKLILVSSPTSPDGVIATEYLRGDQRKWHVACPGCATPFVLEFAHIVADHDDPDKSFARAPCCGAVIDEPTRIRLTNAGQWIATNPTGEPNVHSYHAGELQSVYSSIGRVVREHKRSLTGADAALAFQNLVLGLPATRGAWGVEANTIASRAEPLPLPGGYFPNQIVATTWACDVQQNRLEAIEIGWEAAGADGPMWLLNYRVFHGATTEDDVWQQLMQAFATAKYKMQDGRLIRPAIIGVDAGFLQPRVHEFIAAMRRAGFRAEGVIGRGGWDRPTIKAANNPSRTNFYSAVRFWHSAVDPLKLQVLERLQIATPTNSKFVHIAHKLTPQGNNGDTSFIDGLTSEKLVTAYSPRGVKTQRFEKLRDRNEALDTCAMSLALIHLVDINQITKPTTDADLSRIAAQVAQLNRTHQSPQSRLN